MTLSERKSFFSQLENLPDSYLEELKRFLDYLRFKSVQAGESHVSPYLAAEKSLAKYWDNPEEDEAWKDL